MDLDKYARAVARMAEEGRFDEAVEMANEALSRLPPASEETAAWLALVGELHDGRGDLALAEQAFRQALDTMDLGTRRGPVRLRALTGLSRVYVKLGQPLEAEACAAQAVELLEASEDPSAATVSFALRNLAAVQLLRRDFDAAEGTLERLVSLLGTVLAPDDPELATALADLAYVYEVRGRAREAAGLREDVAAIVSTPFQRLVDRVEELARARGLDDARVADVVARIAEGVPPSALGLDASLADALQELAYVLFVRRRDVDAHAPVAHAFLIDRVRAGQLSVRAVVEQLASEEVEKATASSWPPPPAADADLDQPAL